MLVWMLGPLLLLAIVLMLSFRRASREGERLMEIRAHGGRSQAELTQTLAEAVTRLRGQELAQQARYEVLNGFLVQIVEGLPLGLILVSPQGHVRVINQWAARWLQVPEPVEGRILWNVAGTESLQELATACLDARQRQDGTAAGPSDAKAAFPVTAVPLQTPAGEVDGVLYLVHHERVA
jgi:nitrogen fixation/metabolism regulation signal transduction histidine kinase